MAGSQLDQSPTPSWIRIGGTVFISLLSLIGCGPGIQSQNSTSSSTSSSTTTSTTSPFSFTPTSGAVGTLITVTGRNFSTAQSFSLGGISTLILSQSTTSMQALVMPGTSSNFPILVDSSSNTYTASSSFTITATGVPVSQQGSNLIPAAASSTSFGVSSALSADGNTALIGAAGDNSTVGATWVFTRSGTTWSQQGSKLVGSGNTGAGAQGRTVALSADGNTAMIGSNVDNTWVGAFWIFTRSGTTWTQQGSKLVPSDYDATTGVYLGDSKISLSATGNTAIVGGRADGSNKGAAWIFTRTGTTWTQLGSKLVPSDATSTSFVGGSSVLSADGNTAIIGGWADNSNLGAAWIYTRSGSTWTQQGLKLVPTDATSSANVGFTVSLSADGNTALIGGTGDNSSKGAAWVFTRSGTTWTQQGLKLVPSDATASAAVGSTVSLSADGKTALIGGWNDNSNVGAVWIYTRSGSTWTQQGLKRVGTPNSGITLQGYGGVLSSDGSTALVGGHGGTGGAWVFTP